MRFPAHEDGRQFLLDLEMFRINGIVAFTDFSPVLACVLCPPLPVISFYITISDAFNVYFFTEKGNDNK